MYSKPLLFIILTTLIPATAHTGIYKWTDEEGKTHYSQTRPRTDIESEKLRIHGRKPQYSSDENIEDKDVKKDAEKKDKDKEKAKDEMADTTEPASKLNKKQAKKACADARSRLARMQATGRVRQRDAKGNITYLSDKQKQAAMKKERIIIKKYCK